MNFINLDIRKILLLIPILSLPLITINTQQMPRPSEWYGEPLALVASKSQGFYNWFSDEVRGTASLYLNLIDIKRDNLSLKTQNAELKAQLAAMTELKLENQRLNQLFAFKQKTKMDLLGAKVIGRDLSSDHATIMIDRGGRDGVKPMQAVMTIEGAVGYVFRVDPNTSRVMLITDRYAVVDGIVQRSRARGLVEGKSTDACLLKYVNKSADVLTGDLIVTSGLDRIFPKGLPIATVELVNKKPYTVTLDVELKPVVNPNKVEELFIVRNANQVDLEETLPPQEAQIPTAEVVPAAASAASAINTNSNTNTEAETSRTPDSEATTPKVIPANPIPAKAKTTEANSKPVAPATRVTR
ncbi:MAG: rod shape-determining protein MreC [Pseudomonadota bacterium]